MKAAKRRIASLLAVGMVAGGGVGCESAPETYKADHSPETMRGLKEIIRPRLNELGKYAVSLSRENPETVYVYTDTETGEVTIGAEKEKSGSEIPDYLGVKETKDTFEILIATDKNGDPDTNNTLAARVNHTDISMEDKESVNFLRLDAPGQAIHATSNFTAEYIIGFPDSSDGDKEYLLPEAVVYDTENELFFTKGDNVDAGAPTALTTAQEVVGGSAMGIAHNTMDSAAGQ